MNILVIGLTDNYGGVESFLYNYISKIESPDLHFEFLGYPELMAYENELKKTGCVFYKITAKGKSPCKYYRELNSFFYNNSSKYSAVWVNDCMMANLDILKMAKRYKIPIRIVHSHSSKNMGGKIRGVLHWCNRWRVDKIATEFWACSMNAGKWFYKKKILLSSHYLLVNNALDRNKYKFSKESRKKLRKELNCEDKFVIGHIGRLHFEKNQSFLLDVFCEVQKIIPNAYLLMIGQGSDEEMLRKKSIDLKIQDKILFLGMRHDIHNILSAMDIFVFPSIFEGMPMAPLEAQAAGLPVIASEKALPSEIKISDRFQFVSLDKSAKVWSEKIIKIVQSLKFEKFDREAGLEWILNSKFDLGRESEKMKNIFASLKKMYNL